MFPKYFGDGPLPECMVGDFKSKVKEFGFFHVQATKPDTVGEFFRDTDYLTQRSAQPTEPTMSVEL